MNAARVLAAAMFVVLMVGHARATAPLSLGHSAFALNGPWKFHLGDEPRWALASADDSHWQNIDLTPRPGVHDDDVGLPNYVPGWAARGHAGYYGYAWYRLHFALSAPPGEILALAGPFAVDSAYQLYLNGRLMGGVGDFSGRTPVAFSYHRPALFVLPPDTANAGRVVVAVRAWMGPWSRSPDAGGMHIAPVIGSRGSVSDQYRLQWLILFEGYVVDALEGLALLLLGLMTLSIMPFDRTSRSYIWLAAALLFLAIHRGNQAIMFLGNFETIHAFELFIIVLAIPIYMGAWVMAWRSWFALKAPEWLPGTIIVLTAVYMLAAFLTRSWFRTAYPEIMFVSLHYIISGVRYAFLAFYALTAYQALRHARREALYALPALLVLGVGLYGGELLYLGTPGIWFPFGIGLSLSEIAYALFALLFPALLLRRLWSYASRDRPIKRLYLDGGDQTLGVKRMGGEAAPG
ncbi:MAG TPA: hypothetical protein VHX61_18480 [Rhizomicrobium sp.]|jgi:hypothetical protein|nr:hypothetical protein [Rhizomicrobium sp.]